MAHPVDSSRILISPSSDACTSKAYRRGGKAFTLVELLIVIALIVVLIALLLPKLSMAKEAALDTSCRAQFHQIGEALHLFALDHQSRLPGLWGPPWAGYGSGEGSFMGKEVFTGSYQPAPAAQYGTLVDYLGGESAARKFYRCPALPTGQFRSGIGSNGMFDMTMFQSLPGANIKSLPSDASVELDDGTMVTTPMPVLIEEDPAFGINNQFVDMGHTSINRLGSWHFNNSGNYVAADGGVVHLIVGEIGPEGWNWTARHPNGNEINLGFALQYRGWNIGH